MSKFDFSYGVSQPAYCEKIRKFFSERIPGRKPRVFFKTYGCQQNVSDTEKYKGMFINMGFDITYDKDLADVIMFNTCAIRENAENKAFGNIGWIKGIKNKNPDLYIILCGCMTEQNNVIEKIKKFYPFVDLVFGTHSSHKFPQLFYDMVSGDQSKRYIQENADVVAEGLPIKRDNKLKAFISIMYGCNNFCTYCIVPYVRGRERSRSVESITKEFKSLLDAGYKDITLLGQNVNSYGKGLEPYTDFPDLLKKLDTFDSEYVIRFMTSHPKDATNKLFDTIAESKHIEHHIHLPVQCGSDRILKAMNRKYTTEDYKEKVKYARSKIPDLIITSDIIVGFPGETYEDFLKTVELIKEIKFSSLFTFIYSPREGTVAANMSDNIDKKEKTKWLMELLKEQEKVAAELCKNMLGKKMRVMVENYDSKCKKLMCRTKGNMIVEVESEGLKDDYGKFVEVEVTGYRNECLKGIILKNKI